MPRRVVAVVGTAERPVDSIVRSLASASAQKTTVYLEPSDSPVVGVVIVEGHTPAVQHWKSPEGAFCVVDGEVFNLSDLAPANSNPARVILELYVREGEAAFAKIDAAAAIYLWDAKRRELLVVRDLTGSAPAFIARHQNRTYAASDLFSLVEVGVDRALDMRAVDYFIGHGYSPAPWSYLKSVQKLLPGHLVRVKGAEPAKQRKYEPTFKAWDKAPAPAERLDEIKQRLVRAIDRRRAASGPTGVLLSGGVDSALLLACLVRSCGASSETFTFRYGEYDGVFNEGEEARKIAEQFNVPHRVVECFPRDVSDNMSSLVRDYGEPFTYGLHSFLLGHLKRAGVSAVLSGVGSDGYDVDDSGLGSIYFNRLPKFMRQSARFSVDVLKPVVPALDRKSYAILWSERAGVPSSAYPPNFRDEDRRYLYADKSWLDDSRAQTMALLHGLAAEHAGRTDVDMWRIFNHYGFDSECMLFWNTAWARSFDMELRYPFFDRDLKDYMMHVSPGGKGKRFFREIAATMMPIANARAPKVPQTIPIGHWFRGPLRDLVLDHLAPSRIQDLFDTAVVGRMVDEHLTNRADHTWRLWSLIALVAWRDVLSKELVTIEAQHASPTSVAEESCSSA